MVQVKTLNEKLQPFAHAEVSFDGGPFINTGNKGSLLTEFETSALPIRNIHVKDNQYEVASWSHAKGVIQIVLRKKNYREVSVLVVLEDGKPLARHRIYVNDLKDVIINTDQQGRAVFPIPLDVELTTRNQFTVPAHTTTRLAFVNGEQILYVKPEKPVDVPRLQPVTRVTEQFDLSQLDSIQSLTVFYAVFKNTDMKSLPPETQARIDAKFNELATRQEQANNTNTGREFITGISDSSFVIQDIQNLIRQAEAERGTLTENRDSFNEKIKLITQKLERGLENLDPLERSGLLNDLDLLEKLLIENENRFFMNQEDYRAIINTLKEKYFDIENLESKLIEAESVRLEEQKRFRQRLLVISGILIVFGLLIILLISFSNKLNKQTRALKAANEEITSINENLEKIVQNRTRLLEETNKELDTFLYRSAHDMRAPLRSIMGLCNLAGHLPPDELVKKIAQTTGGLDNVLKRLITISEIGKEDVPKVFTRGTLQSLIDIRFVPEFKQNNIEFNLEAEPDLEFSASPALEEQVLIPLLENAVYFCALKTHEQPRIELTVKQTDKHVVVTVYDNGIGMDELTQVKVFNMFYRGHEQAQGAGLGLYLVNKSVAAMGGSVAVESEPGQYARFTVKLPVTNGVKL